MPYVFNYYTTTSSSNTIIAESTPYDNIYNNILIGSRFNDTIYGESGVNLFNEMHGLRGNDTFYGGSGSGTYNVYVGGAGVDTAVIPSASSNVTMNIDYQGGVTLTRADGGYDQVNSEVEIIQFSGGNKFFNISAGIDDEATVSNQFVWHAGDRLVISNDWLAALNSGSVAISISDVNRDGLLDTVLTGYNGTNSYTLLNYNLNAHPTAHVVGVYGEGILFDLT